MNILLINHYAGSPSLGMEYRPYYMAREWKKAGHNVLIVAASNAHVRSKQFDSKEIFEYKNIEEIDYLIVKTPAYSGNSLGRIKNMFSFVSKLYFNTNEIIREFKPNAVIASSTYPLDIFPATKIAKLSKAKLIFEVHDLWPLSPMELGGFSKWHPFIMIMQMAENYAYKNADKVVSMLPKALEHMKSHGLKEDKFEYIPNGIILDEWDITKALPSEHQNAINLEKSNNRQIIAYAGSHGIANALDSLIEAMQKLQDKPVSLFLIGDGPEKENLKELVKSKQIKNVQFLSSLNKNLIPSLLNKMDILYIGLQNQSLFRFGISPNKLIDYLMAGKPIIQAINAGNDIVSDAKCGISVEPENPQKIAEAITQLLNLTDNDKKRLGQNGHQYCIKNHDYTVLSNRFINAIINA